MDIGEASFLRITTLVEDTSGFSEGLLAEHGLSLLVEAESSGGFTKLLFDCSQSYRTLKHNAEKLRASLRDISFVVLSHCHYDHTGGLIGVLKEAGRIPVVAHPEIYRSTFLLKPKLRYVGTPFHIDDAERAGAIHVLTRSPLKLCEGLATTGEVEKRAEFEAKEALEAYVLSDGRLVRDALKDDLSLMANVRGQIVVISGCSHAGIVSIVEHVSQLIGKPVYAIVGGLHLAGASSSRIELTVRRLKELGVREVAVGHCTGLDAMYRLKEEFGDGFTQLHAGVSIEF